MIENLEEKKEANKQKIKKKRDGKKILKNRKTENDIKEFK